MRIADVMSRAVVAVSPDDSLEVAAGRMASACVGLLPVLERGQLAGVITDRDIVVRAVAQGLPTSAPVRTAMTAQVFTCREEQPLEDAGRLMQSRAVRRLLVIDADNQLVGVISIDDLACTGDAHLAEELAHIASPQLPS